jgi:hypothetical protein
MINDWYRQKADCWLAINHNTKLIVGFSHFGIFLLTARKTVNFDEVQSALTVKL